MSLSSCDLVDILFGGGVILMGKGQWIGTISHCMPSCINDSIPFTI
jgi:hypothetical protein